MKFRPLVFLCWCVACTQIPDCNLDPNTSLFYIEFNQEELPLVTFVSVTNDQSSEVYFDSDSSFSKVQLPITETVGMLTYTFATDSTNYELTLSYDNQVTVYGKECPASIQFTNVEVVSHTFDSVAVTNNILTTRIDENIEVFF